MFYFIGGFLLGAIFIKKYKKRIQILDDLILLTAYNTISNLESYMYKKEDCKVVNIAIKLNSNEIISSLEKKADSLKLTPLTPAQKYFILKYIINDLKFSDSKILNFEKINCEGSYSNPLIFNFSYLYRNTLNKLPVINKKNF